MIGFGLYSVVEVLSAAAVAWQFSRKDPGRYENATLRVIWVAFFLLCTYLSAAVLIGLVLNAVYGWGWADSVAALVIAVFAIREGIEAWKGDTCTTTVAMLTGGGDHIHEG